MKLLMELTDREEFKNEILKPILVIILLHIHWIAVLSFIAYIFFEIYRYLSTVAPFRP
jgi:hypothetical protein